jgi:hypothetical protein
MMRAVKTDPKPQVNSIASFKYKINKTQYI